MKNKRIKSKTGPREVALRLTGQMVDLSPDKYRDKYHYLLKDSALAAELIVKLPEGWHVDLLPMYENHLPPYAKAEEIKLLLVKAKDCKR
jgi:hypothetical protein